MIRAEYSLYADGAALRGTQETVSIGNTEIQTTVREWADMQAAYWLHTFRNTGDADGALISDVLDCDVLLPLPEGESGRLPGYLPDRGNNARVISMAGMVPGREYNFSPERSAEEYSMHDRLFADRPVQEYASLGARSSDGTMPFFDVNLGDHGYIVAIGWTGGWRARFSLEEGGVRVQTGLKKTSFRLHPGEDIRTSSVLIMEYHEGQQEARNRFRRLVRREFSLAGQPGRPKYGIMGFEHWGGLTTDEICRRLGKMEEHDVRFDYHWIDAGWYGLSTPACDSPYVAGWSQNTGDWRISPQCHPNGMAEIVEAEKRLGMKMMLWIEPERCVAKTPACREHPEWFLEAPGADPSNEERSLMLDLGNEEARQYCFDTLCGLFDRLNVGCYRQDFNWDPAGVWEAADEAERVGMHEIRHIMGMYRLWEALLERYPDLVIDNCASGGRRIDIESVSRSVPFFRSDYQCGFNTEPDVTQVHGSGISNYLPFNGCTTKTKSDIYAIRSTYSSSWGGAFWCTRFLELSDEELEWAAAVSREYKRLQPYFCEDFYNHGTQGLDSTAWCIWQYDRPAEKDGIVIAFRRKDSPCPAAAPVLGGLEKGRKYLFTDIDSGEEWTLSAEELEKDGLMIGIRQKRASRVILYRAIG